MEGKSEHGWVGAWRGEHWHLWLIQHLLTSTRSAVEEGKMIYYNIRNFVRFQLST